LKVALTVTSFDTITLHEVGDVTVQLPDHEPNVAPGVSVRVIGVPAAT